MRPLRTRLLEARKDLGIPREVLEWDYLLSWILAGIGEVDALRDSLVFAVREVTFSRPENFFPDAMLVSVGRTWDQWLGPLVPALPPFEKVIGELRPQIVALVQSDPPIGRHSPLT